MDNDSSAKVLVVDDEQDIRDTMATFLADLGYAVSCAASGDEAVKMVEADPSLTLLLTDIEMPGKLRGFALARRAKTIRPDLRVIYVTGHSDLSRIDPLALHGPIMRKPFRLVHLADAIARVMAQAEASLVTARASEAKAFHDLDEARLEAARQRDDNALLRAAADRATAMNLAKSHLLATVGHDLRQPLTVIVGTLELLAGKLDGAGQKMVARAEVAATRLTEAIDSILEGARLAFTGIEPKVKPFPIAPLLGLLCDAHEPITAGTGASWHVKLGSATRNSPIVQSSIDQPGPTPARGPPGKRPRSARRPTGRSEAPSRAGPRAPGSAR
jgi:CheY-like chemotaxis protein